MKVTIQGTFEFRLAITLEDVEILRKVSAKHYDAVCREASAESARGFDPANRNFLTSWRNSLEMDHKFPSEDGSPSTVTATWRNLDCSLKILEGINLFELTGIERLVAERIRYDFIRVLAAARPLYDQWRVELDTKGVAR